MKHFEKAFFTCSFIILSMTCSLGAGAAETGVTVQSGGGVSSNGESRHGEVKSTLGVDEKAYYGDAALGISKEGKFPKLKAGVVLGNPSNKFQADAEFTAIDATPGVTQKFMTGTGVRRNNETASFNGHSDLLIKTGELRLETGGFGAEANHPWAVLLGLSTQQIYRDSVMIALALEAGCTWGSHKEAKTHDHFDQHIVDDYGLQQTGCGRYLAGKGAIALQAPQRLRPAQGVIPYIGIEGEFRNVRLNGKPAYLNGLLYLPEAPTSYSNTDYSAMGVAGLRFE
jgi:hypothetical protein